MIEINLLPGSGKKSKRRGMPKLNLGSVSEAGKSMPSFNGGMFLGLIGWAAGVLLLGWMIVGARVRKADLNASIEAAVLDSARLAEIIKTTDDLNNRMRAVAGKLQVVQDVDANRYVWSHLLDEVARAVPEHTWLVRITNLPSDSGVKVPKFALEGRTGNNFALTKYLQQLEASPFIRGVRLKESQLVREEEKLIYSFSLDADYEVPPPDLIQTEPLFAANLEESGIEAGARAQKAINNAPPPGARNAPAAKNVPAVNKNAPAARPRTQEPR